MGTCKKNLRKTTLYYFVGNWLYDISVKGDEWYYGTIEKVSCVDTSKTYKIRFDDGTSESNVSIEYIQFISRPDEVDTGTVIRNVDDNREDDVISLLDPLGENNIVEDVEIQELWEN